MESFCEGNAKKNYMDFRPFIISKCEIMNFANCILLVRESRGCRDRVTKAGAGIDWVNSVHTSAATSYTTNCCDNIVSCLIRHYLSKNISMFRATSFPVTKYEEENIDTGCRLSTFNKHTTRWFGAGVPFHEYCNLRLLRLPKNPDEEQ